jgi:predicted helicase
VTRLTITSPQKLAQMMASKALLIKDILGNAVRYDEELSTELAGQYQAFRTLLLHDVSPDEFADIYAETIAYGMFAARLHDKTLKNFSRSEALELLPKSSPFLRSLFGYIAGPDLDDRIRWVIDDLASLLQATDVAKLLEGFGDLTGKKDPFLHFYEAFLAVYNPKKRKARGVWYTPEPVVNFIVRAVDDVLRTEFGLSDGLADASKITIDWDTCRNDKMGRPISVKKEVHRVQILDPATGTGTFLAEVIKQIAPKVKDLAEGLWSSYIEHDLIPRLHGYEILMASYSMCHLKLDMILTEMGYKPAGSPPRFGVYLTNSLEEGERDVRSLSVAPWLTREVHEANQVKRQAPVMCIIGNPPYSMSGLNKNDWITHLVSSYKEDLDETSINALSDDYVKFLRVAEHLIEKNGSGIVGMITNNSFLDGVVHRRMRLHLRQTFDSIYIVNLHGDSNKRECSLDGRPDQNVFDIKQGVSIIIAVKQTRSDSLADVWGIDLYGTRQEKYHRLWQEDMKSIAFSPISEHDKHHFFTNKVFANRDTYEAGFKVTELFQEGKSGIKFRKDNLLIRHNFSRFDVVSMVRDVQTLDTRSLLSSYNFKETTDWTHENQRANFEGNPEDSIIEVAYRPLDFRFTYYPLDRISRIIPRGDSRHGLMRHMLAGENLALVIGRQNKSGHVDHFLAVNRASEMKTGERTIQSYHLPLYLYPASHDLDQERRVNFDTTLHSRLKVKVGQSNKPPPDELAIFDYVYGVLYSPGYRSKYAEFIKVDFPLIPWPASPEEFWDVSTKGSQLRRLHLMEPIAIGKAPYPFRGDGDSIPEAVHFSNGKVWINETQYFADVPELSWNFYIGGYQPAQKWLKDRKGRALSFDDVRHYQRIIKILHETDRIMQTITLSLDSERTSNPKALKYPPEKSGGCDHSLEPVI